MHRGIPFSIMLLLACAAGAAPSAQDVARDSIRENRVRGVVLGVDLLEVEEPRTGVPIRFGPALEFHEARNFSHDAPVGLVDGFVSRR